MAGHPYRQPGSDVVEARVDDEQLTNDDTGALFNLLTVAGTDTTRNSTGHAVRLLAEVGRISAWAQTLQAHNCAPFSPISSVAFPGPRSEIRCSNSATSCT